jgi:IclR family mhp operon transcriptional activator
MLVRETTDHASPLAVERFSAGFRIPLLTTSSGRVYLAFCPREQRDCLLEILSRSPRAEDALAKSRPEVERLLDETREQGYATATRPRRVSEESVMAVPVLVEDRVLATVAVRFSATAVPPRVAVERFLPKLRATAQKIRQKFTDAQRERIPPGEQPARIGGLP